MEVTAVVLVVAALPKLPLQPYGRSATRMPADERPSLVQSVSTLPAFPELDPATNRWRLPADRAGAAPLTASLPAPDPAYVEDTLDQVGQQLLAGFSSYLGQTAREILAPAPAKTAKTAARPDPLEPAAAKRRAFSVR
jgi:hypothetical protein